MADRTRCFVRSNKWSSISLPLIRHISENEVRKDFSKAERIEYARRLEKIEAAKAKERQKETQFGSNTVCPNLVTPDNQRTDAIVAAKLGIGGRETYRKEKFIVDNRSSLAPEDFADWDEEDKDTVVNPDGNRGNHYPDLGYRFEL